MPAYWPGPSAVGVPRVDCVRRRLREYTVRDIFVQVPRIAEFDGIVVYIYFDEHVPPHFHAVYGEHEAVIDFTTCVLVEGSLPRAKLRRTIAWARENQSMLTVKWAEITGM
jgi:hypothetical protein